MPRSTHATNQLHYAGGLLVGTGLGIWLFPIIARTGMYRAFGMLGMVLAGFALVFVGVALGLPRKTDSAANERATESETCS